MKQLTAEERSLGDIERWVTEEVNGIRRGLRRRFLFHGIWKKMHWLYADLEREFEGRFWCYANGRYIEEGWWHWKKRRFLEWLDTPLA